MSYITKNLQGPVTLLYSFYKNKMSYITKNLQGPVTFLIVLEINISSYITKNLQGPVTWVVKGDKFIRHILLKIYRVL